MNRLTIITVSLLITFLLGLATGWFWWGSTANLQEARPILSRKNTTPIGHSSKQSKPSQKLQEHDLKDLVETASSARDKPPASTQTAKDIIDQVLSEIKNAGSGKADNQKMWKRLQELRRFGEEGSQAILEFFRTNEDVPFEPDWQAGWGLSAEEPVYFHSLRTALLEILYEMKDPTAQTADLEFLQTASSSQEALLAIKNLEKASPGVYRTQALQAASEILTDLLEKPDAQFDLQNSKIFEIVGYYQAQELLPLVEDCIKRQPLCLYNWLSCVVQFPTEDQVSALERLSADKKIHEGLVATNSYLLVQLDYRNDRLRQMTGELFKEMDVNKKADLIQRVGESGIMKFGGGFTLEFNRPNIPTYHKKDGIEASLKLLSEIEPSLDSAILKAHLEVSRLKLQEALAKAKE